MIGDVVGHGVDSAAGMGQIRSALRAYALDGHRPAGVLDGSTALCTRSVRA